MLDTDGYVTSRPRNVAGAGSAMDDVPMSNSNPMEDEGEVNACAVLAREKSDGEPNVKLASRLAVFHDELIKCNMECKHWKSQCDKMSVTIKRMTRNQTYEVRLLQRAIITFQNQGRKFGKPAGEYLEQYTRIVLERNELVNQLAQQESQCAQLKQQVLRMEMERDRSTRNILQDGDRGADERECSGMIDEVVAPPNSSKSSRSLELHQNQVCRPSLMSFTLPVHACIDTTTAVEPPRQYVQSPGDFH